MSKLAKFLISGVIVLSSSQIMASEYKLCYASTSGFGGRPALADNVSCEEGSSTKRATYYFKPMMENGWEIMHMSAYSSGTGREKEETVVFLMHRDQKPPTTGSSFK